ncbi:MAG: substrate-binding domain-containing protein, partial [Streptosporangiaceae bacterium]|nr:substrate-binding domain-containing protein [Streptosporangiaceae bacterium]
GGTGAETPSWGYSYVPDVAGGTAFMYHITVAGHLVTNLRLSGLTLTKIFTGVITNWDDPAITHDYGAQLPNEPITPVIRSDGSGATFFLTRYMAHVYPDLWNAFCQRVHPGIKLPCPQTEFYPPFGAAKAENGSNNVSTYITSSYGEGSIGYDEYAYALNAHWPVVAMANPAGYDVLPTASNVAVALTQAVIDENPSDPNYLQQNLDKVYTFTDPRSYPLSSYSYLIVPKEGTRIPPVFNNGVGASLSTFIDFYLCAGQQQSAQLGYSPLPLNLVQGGLHQSDLIPGHVPGPNPTTLAGCNNPTFTNGVLTLLKNAPYPTACQKVTAPLSCSGGGGGTNTGGGGTKGGGNGHNTTGRGGNTSGGTNNPVGGLGGTGNGTGSGNGYGTGAQSANVTGSIVNVPGNGADRVMLAVLTALAVATAVAAPPTVAIWLRRRRGGAR